MGKFLDTQILSYWWKGDRGSKETDAHISAVVASEFLLMRGECKDCSSYCVLLPTYAQSPVIHDIRRVIPSGRRTRRPRRCGPSTDQVVLEFGNEFPAIRMHGLYAVSELINLQNEGGFEFSIRHLEKDQQKLLRDRFRFLLSNDVSCVPLSKRAIDIGLDLLREFCVSNNVKSDFRNTVNDILILATAVDTSSQLLTKDSVLNKFAASQFQATQQSVQGELLIDFTGQSSRKSKNSNESKGYINRNWQARMFVPR